MGSTRLAKLLRIVSIAINIVHLEDTSRKECYGKKAHKEWSGIICKANCPQVGARSVSVP